MKLGSPSIRAPPDPTMVIRFALESTFLTATLESTSGFAGSVTVMLPNSALARMKSPGSAVTSPEAGPNSEVAGRVVFQLG